MVITQEQIPAHYFECQAEDHTEDRQEQPEPGDGSQRTQQDRPIDALEGKVEQ